MVQRRILKIGAALSASVGLFGFSEAQAAPQPRAEQGPHWSYDHQDEWTGLCQDGEAQSPVDLRSSGRQVRPITIHYPVSDTAPTVVNNGHTIQVDMPAGLHITWNDVQYDLKQFHFHLPSEHASDGKRAAMEVHFVHQDANGKLAVLGVLITATGKNATLAPIWKLMPDLTDEPTTLSAPIDVHALLPSTRDTARYSGSLTTPPCTEGVNWAVFKKRISISDEQCAAYRKLFSMTARDLQPLNGREVTRRVNTAP